MRSLEAESGAAYHPFKQASLPRSALLGALFAFALASLAVGCAAPGNPTPPRTGIPRAVSDLAGHQEGAAVVLTFTVPTKSVTDDSLDVPPDVDVYRAPTPAAGAKPQWQLVLNVPGAAVESYLRAGKVEISDSLDSATAARGTNLVYIVRTRTSKKHASADSNAVAVHLLLATAAPTGLHANVTEAAVILSWSAPTADISGTALASVTNLTYHLYRGELDTSSAAAPSVPSQSAQWPSQDLAHTKLKSPLTLIGSPPSATEFRDEHFTFGASYVYIVRAVANGAAEAPASATPQNSQSTLLSQPQVQSVESADSAALFLAPKDIFPPASPTGVVVAVVAATNQEPAYVELSWEANGEPDLAGYWVYRSEDSGTQGSRINSQLLLSPVFRDTTSAAGKRYFYRVTAVDQAGNESPPGAAIAVEVPQQ